MPALLKQLQIAERARELLDEMDRRYLEALEAALEEEAQILAKGELGEEDRLRLAGAEAIKKIAAAELGARYELPEGGELGERARELLELASSG